MSEFCVDCRNLYYAQLKLNPSAKPNCALLDWHTNNPGCEYVVATNPKVGGKNKDNCHNPEIIRIKIKVERLKKDMILNIQKREI